MLSPRLALAASLALALPLAAACSEDGDDKPAASPSPTPAASETPAPSASTPPAGSPTPSPTPSPTGPAWTVLDIAVRAPFQTPADPLADTDVRSCSTFQARRCEEGRQLRCEVYDSAGDSFVADESVDPLLRRALLYDRWYELYGAPDGITSDRAFTGAMPPGTPEEVWGAPESFADFHGRGDGAIWTGAALNAFLMRYLTFGTEADYQRLEKKVRQMVTLFDVTGMPGYLSRYYYLLLPPGAPTTDAHNVEHGDEPHSHEHRPMGYPAAVPELPEFYLTGLRDAEGTLHEGELWWGGHPSIDQYSGALIHAAAYNLMRDDNLKQRIARHLTCYLNRLERLEIINLQQNPEAISAVRSTFAGSGEGLWLDEGDPDFEDLDRVVAYYLRNNNETNDAEWFYECPDEVTRTAGRVIDATSPLFVLEVLELVNDLDRTMVRPNSIDHIYIPSVRGFDAVHLMGIAAFAWHVSGDERYKRFITEELMGNIGSVEVANTLGAFTLPHWCEKHYGNHISYSPMWAFVNLLDDSELKDEMLKVLHVEQWEKRNYNLGNVKFNVMYASVMPNERYPEARATILDSALTELRGFGGNGGILDDPRRTYSIAYEDAVATLPEGVEPICPTEEQRLGCEEGPSVFGVQLSGSDITRACTGAPNECMMSNGECTWKLASGPLTAVHRPWADFVWQRNPFQLGVSYSVEGGVQSPGVDLLEPYWMARRYGFITEGQGQVLAWRDVGACD